MQKKYGPKGFTVVSVSGDPTTREAGAFAKEIRATFPVLHDTKTAVFEKFDVEALPTNLVVGRDGKIQFAQEGADVKALEAAVAKAVQGGKPMAKPKK
jgi:peroxiredoxin